MKKVSSFVMSVILALGIMLNAVACSGSEGKTVKVSFVTDCDDKIGVIYLDVGDYYGQLPTPKNTEDYKFLGWYTNDKYDGNAITPHTRVSITTDHKLYAKWEYVGKITTITFKPGNGEEDIVRQYKAGYAFGELPTPSPRDGYVFEGWGNLKVEDIAPNQDKTYTAKWTFVGPIPVSFETGYEVEQPTLNLMVGKPYGTLPNPTRKDYEFLGWEYVNGRVTEIVTAETLVPSKKEVTLTAKWKYVGDTTINLVSEGESFVPLKIKQGEKLSGLPTPKSKDGYTYLGWYTQDKFYGERMSEGDEVSGETLTLYARYEKNSEVDERRTTLAATRDAQSFAIEDGKLYAWGRNSQGRLGIDSTEDKLTPTLLTDDMTFTEVAVGYNGVYALDSNDNAWMWGEARNVLVTDTGTSTTSSTYKTPTRMFEDGAFASLKLKSISAGGKLGSELIYAIDSSDKLCKIYREKSTDGEWGWAWTRLLTSRNIKKVSVGGEHVLAIDSDGKLWALGGNRSGQLGDDTFADKDFPVQIMSDKRFITVSAGNAHSLAVDYDGRLWVWGSSNTDGMNKYNAPTVILPDKTFVSVSAGDGYSFAIDSDGKAWSWGSNKSGRLGNGATETNRTPYRIADGLGFAEISQACSSHVLARSTDGKYYTWGDNTSGALGNGTSPVDTNIPTGILEDQTFKYVYAEGGATFALDTDGRLYTWGKSKYGYDNDKPTHVEPDILFDTLSFGDNHILGIDLDGNLWAWGGNSDGQLGDGTKTDKAHPVQIMSGSKFTKISASINISFAIDEDGKLWAWGSNQYGRFGNGSTTDRVIPTNVKTGSRFIDVCATDMRTYVIDTDGTMWCCGVWGEMFAPNVSGILQDGVWYIPAEHTTTFLTVSEGIKCSAVIAETCDDNRNGKTFFLSTDGQLYGFWYEFDQQAKRYNSHVVKMEDSRKYKKLSFSIQSGIIYGIDENDCLYYNNYRGYSGKKPFKLVQFDKLADKKISFVSGNNYDKYSYEAAIDTDGQLYIWGTYDKTLWGFDTYDYSATPTQIQVG